MKLLTFLLFVALVGQISAHAYPRYYRTEFEESSEAEEPQSDEADNENEEPQDDDVSVEDDEEKPPTFNRLFPSPQNGRPGSGGVGPTNQAFQTMMHEIDENGWKRPKENPTSNMRSNPAPRRRFRDDDEESDEEDDAEDDAEDDEPYAPDFDQMFPANPEERQAGPTNMGETPFADEPVPVASPGAIIGSGGAPSFGRSGLYHGRSQAPQTYYRQSAGRPNVRYVQRPTYVRATVTPVRAPASFRPGNYGNKRVIQFRPTPSYYFGNRRTVQTPVVAHRQPSYNMGGYRDRQPMGGYRQSMMAYYRGPGQNMGGYQQPGPVYVNNAGRRQYQYVALPVRRQNVQPMYSRRPVQQYSQSPYVVRARRNQRFWSKK